jgi:5-methylcytosine-specific restriction endonuclease McrA
MGQRSCAQCSGPLPDGSQKNRVYCSKVCTSAAYYARKDPERRRAESNAWYAKNRERRAPALLAAKTDLKCQECGERLPPTSHVDRKFCSRKCINTRSLRENLAQIVEAGRRRRARMNGPGVSRRDWNRLTNRHGGRCAYCNASAPLTMDHVVPIIRGGQHAIGNILPACLSCNSSKRARLLADWLRWRRMKSAA